MKSLHDCLVMNVFFYRNFYKLRGSKFVVDNKIMIFRKAEAEKVFLIHIVENGLKKAFV